MGRCERCETPQRLDSLSFCRDGPSAVALVRRDDDVHQSLEEVALVVGAVAPRKFELFVRSEVLARLREREALLVAPVHDANVGLGYGNDPVVRGRPLHPGEARGGAA
jgi:hypothetical protein